MTDEAMIEEISIPTDRYSVMEITKDGTIWLTGFRKQKEYDWKK